MSGYCEACEYSNLGTSLCLGGRDHSARLDSSCVQSIADACKDGMGWDEMGWLAGWLTSFPARPLGDDIDIEIVDGGIDRQMSTLETKKNAVS